MKREALTTFSMLALLLVMTAVSANAQNQRTKTVTNIPFEFNVGDKTLPAGEYTVRPNRSYSQNVWLIQNREEGINFYFFTMSVSSGQSQEGKLVFHRYGNQYFLSQIWRSGDNSGRKLEIARRERELAQIGAKPRTIVLLSGSQKAQTDALRGDEAAN